VLRNGVVIHVLLFDSLLLCGRPIHFLLFINFDFVVFLPLHHSKLRCFGIVPWRALPVENDHFADSWHVEAFLLHFFTFQFCVRTKMNANHQSHFTTVGKDFGVVLHTSLEQEGCFLAVPVVLDKTHFSSSFFGGCINVGCFACSAGV